MGMLFGGWAEEEEQKSDEERGYDKGFRRGLVEGWNQGIEKAQLAVTQSKVEHAMKLEIHLLLEELKRKE